jgi:peptide/nickel transport system substrate-binding protein
MNISASPTGWNILNAGGRNNSGFIYTYQILPHAFIPDAQGTMQLNTDLLSSAKVTSTSPFTITYEVKPEAVWSDGTAINADDFTYVWKTSSTAGCPDCGAGVRQGYDSIESVTGSNGGKTVVVTFKTPYQPWQYLFDSLLPAHIAAEHGSLADSFNKYFMTTVPTWSGGPFIVSSYTPNVSTVYKPNPKWYSKQPGLSQFTLQVISDPTAKINAFQNNEIQVLQGYPDASSVQTLKSVSGATVDVNPTLLDYRVLIQNSGAPLKDQALRQAIATTISASAAISRTVGQFNSSATPLGSALVLPGQKIGDLDAYKDAASALGVGSGDVAKAKQILTAAGYTWKDNALYAPDGTKVRALTGVTYSSDTIRVQLAQIVQEELQQIGVTMNIQSVGGSQYSAKITGKQFDIVFTGVSFEPVTTNAAGYWVTDAPNNWVNFSDKQVDTLLQSAVSSASAGDAVKDVQEADKLVLASGSVVPLFASPGLFAFQGNVTGVSPTASRYGPTTNLQDWGVK